MPLRPQPDSGARPLWCVYRKRFMCLQMKGPYVFIFLALFAARAAGAQERDTLRGERVYEIDRVVVTGTRHGTDMRHLSQTVSVVDRTQIERAMQPSLLPVLTERVPGLFVTSRGVMGYGVSGGAAGNISLRGLSGGAGRLMVMIDGHPQYAGIFGHPIADACQSFMAERVEVLRGPASVLYGSNAMGGVVNIVTRKMAEDGVKTALHAGYGSYNTLETELVNRIRKGRFSSVVSGSYDRTDGHRADMGFEQYGGYAKLGYELAESWSVRGDVNVTHFNASYPGPAGAPLIDGDQRITRGMTSFAVENDYGKGSGAVSLFYNWGRHRINDGYAPGEEPLDVEGLGKRFQEMHQACAQKWPQLKILIESGRRKDAAGHHHGKVIQDIIIGTAQVE